MQKADPLGWANEYHLDDKAFGHIFILAGVGAAVKVF
jgi:hypothetical protein